MFPIIKKLLVLIFFPCLIFSCTFAQEGKVRKRELADSSANNNIVSGLTIEQESAFDALNTLQVSTDEKNRLYSTFADIVHSCYPPDTSFVITQSELLIAMMQFVQENSTNLNIDAGDKLIRRAVLAQKEYTVLHCTGNLSNINYEKGLPLIGTWVMPSILDRRDVVLVW